MDLGSLQLWDVNVLRFHEVRQDILVTPSDITSFQPAVKIIRVAPCIDVVVDNGSTTDSFAGRPWTPRIV